MRKQYHVILTPQERADLQALVAAGTAPSRMLTPARILLKADSGPEGPAWTDEAIVDALEVGCSTVARVRQRFALCAVGWAWHSNASRRSSRQYRASSTASRKPNSSR